MQPSAFIQYFADRERRFTKCITGYEESNLERTIGSSGLIFSEKKMRLRRMTSRNLLLLGLCLAPQTASLGAELAPLAEKINHRLSYMKDVAGFKAQNHLPVEDVAQEAKVLDSGKAEARKLGLDPATVGPFIAAQMNAAKAIQYRYQADWLAQSEKGWQPRPLDKVRQDIARLSDEILQQLVQDLRSGPIEPGERSKFYKAVQEHNLKQQDKKRLFDALITIRLAQHTK